MASPTSTRIWFQIKIWIALMVVLFYIGHPLYWMISATIPDIRHNKQSVNEGISQIVHEAQRSVGWYHDESDYVLLDVQNKKSRVSASRRFHFDGDHYYRFLNMGKHRFQSLLFTIMVMNSGNSSHITASSVRDTINVVVNLVMLSMREGRRHVRLDFAQVWKPYFVWPDYNRSSVVVHVSDGYIAIFPALTAESLSKLTLLVSFVIVPGHLCNRSMVSRRLIQFYSELIYNKRPERKPPWKLHIFEVHKMTNTSYMLLSSETRFFKKTLIRKCWYQCVFFSELHCDTSAFRMRFVRKMSSQKMLHTNHIRERSNMKLDNNRYYYRLANKTTLRKASSISLLLFFLSIWLIPLRM